MSAQLNGSAGTAILARLARYNLDLNRRGLVSAEPVAVLITNEEALQVLAEGRRFFPVGAQEDVAKWLAAGEGWQLSGRMTFFGRHVCVLR